MRRLSNGTTTVLNTRRAATSVKITAAINNSATHSRIENGDDLIDYLLLGSSAARSCRGLSRMQPGDDRGLDKNAPQPRRRLPIAHEPLASPAVLLIELVQHSHAGLDLCERGLGARQDRSVLGERYAERAGSRRDVAAGLFCRSDPRSRPPPCEERGRPLKCPPSERQGTPPVRYFSPDPIRTAPRRRSRFYGQG